MFVCWVCRKCEDPEWWRTVRDPSTGQDVRLSKQDLELLHRLRQGQVPDPDHDEYKVPYLTLPTYSCNRTTVGRRLSLITFKNSFIPLTPRFFRTGAV